MGLLYFSSNEKGNRRLGAFGHLQMWVQTCFFFPIEDLLNTPQIARTMRGYSIRYDFCEVSRLTQFVIDCTGWETLLNSSRLLRVRGLTQVDVVCTA